MKPKSLPSELFFSRTYDYLYVFLPEQAAKSNQTIRSYRDALSIFRKYLLKELNISITKFRFTDCTYECVLDYVRFLIDKKGYAPASVNQRLAAIKSYLQYASDCDVSLLQVYFRIMNVPFQTVPKVQRPIIEKDMLMALLNAPKNDRFGIRDKAILILLFDTAIRVNELVNLKIDNFNFEAERPYLRIHGKGNKERIVALRPQTIQHLKLYMTYYEDDPEERTRYLFYTTSHGVRNIMSERNVERIVKKYADIIRVDYPDLPDKVYPHMFRRTRATGLYRDGVEMELISRILGHSSTQTTRIYATPSITMLKKAMDKGIPDFPEEKPEWLGHEDELIKACGLK